DATARLGGMKTTSVPVPPSRVRARSSPSRHAKLGAADVNRSATAFPATRRMYSRTTPMDSTMWPSTSTIGWSNRARIAATSPLIGVTLTPSLRRAMSSHGSDRRRGRTRIRPRGARHAPDHAEPLDGHPRPRSRRVLLHDLPELEDQLREPLHGGGAP